jgi:hypothetical protein
MEAYQVLATVYGSFTEGFDTRPLIEARTLLEMLVTGGSGLAEGRGVEPRMARVDVSA